MSTIGSRLREERKRLGLNQSDFAASGGVGKHSQINYESGERYPDADYLSRVGGLGVDLGYVLSGSRLSTLCAAGAGLGIAEVAAEPYSPAERLAAEIAALPLTEQDADSLGHIAKRLAEANKTA